MFTDHFAVLFYSYNTIRFLYYLCILIRIYLYRILDTNFIYFHHNARSIYVLINVVISCCLLTTTMPIYLKTQTFSSNILTATALQQKIYTYVTPNINHHFILTLVWPRVPPGLHRPIDSFI